MMNQFLIEPINMVNRCSDMTETIKNSTGDITL